MAEAFGPYHMSSQCPIQPMDEPLHPADRLVIVASAFCCAALLVIFTFEHLGYF